MEERRKGEASGAAHTAPCLSSTSPPSPGAASRPDWPDRVRSYAAAISAAMAAGDDDSVIALDDDAAAAARAEHAAWDWAGLLFLGSDRRDGALGEAVSAWARTHAAALAVCGGGGEDEGGAGCTPLAPAITRLLASPAPDADPAYWPTLGRAVAAGWGAEAVALLGVHGAWAEASAAGGLGAAAPGAMDTVSLAALAVLDPVGLLVRGQPRLGSGGGGGGVAAAAPPSTATAHASMVDFMAARAAWLAFARRLAGDGALWERAAAAGGDAATTAGGCRALLRVLCAEPGAVDAAALGVLTVGPGASSSPSPGGWPDLLAARCLHPPDGSPGPVTPGELASAAARAAADVAAAATFPLSPTSPAAAARDAMLLGVAGAAGTGEPAGAAAALSAGCSAWAMTAVTPVLYARGGPGAGTASGEPLSHAGGRSGEWWALDLASSLAGSAVTRPAAARLLASACPTHGAGGAYALFARAPGADAAGAGDDAPAMKAAATAAHIGCTSGEAAVARAAGVAHWSAGRPGAALAWLARAGDGGRGAAVAGEAADEARGALLLRPLTGAGAASDRAAAAAAALVADLVGPLAELEGTGGRCGDRPTSPGVRALAALAAATSLPAHPARAAAAALATAASGPPSAVPAALFAAIPALEAAPTGGGAVAAVPEETVSAMVALLDEAQAKAAKAEDDGGVGAAVEGAVRLALARALARAYVAG